MNFIKPLALVAFIAAVYFSGALSSFSTFAHSTILNSGLLNASATSDGKDPFDYNFIVKDLSGKRLEFKEFQGKVVFLNLWATWCAPCRAEMASIQKLYDTIDHERISFVMLSLDKDSQIERVKSYVKNNPFTFPVYMPSGYLADQLRVPSIPTTFVICKDGTIALKEIGMKNYNTSKFKKFLEELTR